MIRSQFWLMMVVVSMLCGVGVGVQAEGESQAVIVFDEPRQEGGLGVLSALKQRHSTRTYKDKAIPQAVLGDLLWAAFGVNRPESGKRTAPSSFDWQDIDIYVFLPDGVWRYNAQAHRLEEVMDGDHRELAGVQAYVHTAPLSLVYVSDLAKMTHDKLTFPESDKLRTGALHAGHISQNVYLFGASEGLGVVARGAVDRERFKTYFKLRPEQHVMMGQTVGYAE